MNPLLAILLVVVAIQGAAIIVLLVRTMRRSRDQLATRKNEERFRLMADRAPVMMWTARPDTTLDFINHTCVQFTGLSAERLMDNGWMDICHPEDLDPCIAIYMPAVEARLPFTMEYRLRGADGAYHWFLASAIPRYATDGLFTGYIGCSLDITGRKEAEYRIRESQAALEESHQEIQHLAGRLIEAQDTERARVARDLHDDVSQQLAGLSIAFSGLRQRMQDITASEDLQAELRSLHERTTALAQNVRHLSHDLHPTVLRHAGLVAALNSYCSDIERSHGTVSRCSAEGDVSCLRPEAALCLYRVAQEALRNVVAHAGAHRADVRLLRQGDYVELTVADDGGGFDVAGSLRRGEGLGLVSITERIRLAKGSVSITSEPGQGTCVRVRIQATAPARSDTGMAHEAEAGA